jgi:hypothetical protein
MNSRYLNGNIEKYSYISYSTRLILQRLSKTAGFPLFLLDLDAAELIFQYGQSEYDSTFF